MHCAFPRGLMRVQTVSSASCLYFDFGGRAFSIERIPIPRTASTAVLEFSAQCHQPGESIHMKMMFLAEGFVKLSVPVNAIVPPGAGCKNQPGTMVELTGMCMGAVE